MKSIPKILYPIALDSDYTLFTTHNSTQSTLIKELGDTDDVIEINAQEANAAEVWADNGFATIGDELIYYDSVVKNNDGKVYQLKDCIRGVEGTPVNYNINTAITSNVVAQTHNQLVDAIIAIQNAIGDISDILKIGPELKTQQLVRKNLVAVAPRNTLQDANFAFTASLHQSLTTMLGCCNSAGDDVCPDVEFEFNNMGTIAEYCVRIFGNYNSFQIDFGDGITETGQLSGTHQYTMDGPYNPTVTVQSNNCTIVQSPTPPNEFSDGPVIPNPSVPFVINIPDIPAFPEFVAPRMVCPGPLLNLPPIIFPPVNGCSPSTCCISEISIIGCCPPSEISIIGCCLPSIVEIIGCSIPSIISFDHIPQFSCISFCDSPIPACISFCDSPIPNCISFCDSPIPNCISFCDSPIPNCISFCDVPHFDPISFAPFPVISPVQFDVNVRLSVTLSTDCISFCPPPHIPPISVDWGTPPLLSCVVRVVCPSDSCPSTTPMAMTMAPMAGLPFVDDGDAEIPLTMGDIGIPEEIKLIVPHIPDIKVSHDIPKEIKIIGDVPKSIELVHNLPEKIGFDITNFPTKIIVEPASNFPNILKMEVVGIPETLQVVGIPKTIEIIGNIPSTIQMLMPENPVVEMKWNGTPVELKASPDLEKLLSSLIVTPR